MRSGDFETVMPASPDGAGCEPAAKKQRRRPVNGILKQASRHGGQG